MLAPINRDDLPIPIENDEAAACRPLIYCANETSHGGSHPNKIR
jgi:hypothetical protein